MNPEDQILIDACLEAGAVKEEHGPGIVTRSRSYPLKDFEGCESNVGDFLTLRWQTAYPPAVRPYHLLVRGSDERDFGCGLITFNAIAGQPLPSPYAFEEVTE